MANPNKAKGTRWESAIRDYLNSRLNLVDSEGALRSPFSAFNIRRAAQEGAKDVGDLHAYPFILEAKDTAKHDIPGYIRQANVEAKNARFPFGAAVLKKRNANAGDAYVCMDLETFSRVLSKIREAYDS